MKIVFYGTPGFAVETLQRLYEAGYDIAAVVTTPDKPAGRGLKPRPSPVKQAAQQLNLPVLQPDSLKDNDFINKIKTIQPDLQVVVAFRILPREIWQIPPMGTINLHASYLPNYRGAAPINWVLINGEKFTGVTTFFINDKVDTGNIILRKKVEIYPDDDAGSLHDRLMTIGANLVVETVKLIEQKRVKPIPQEQLMADIGQLKTAPKIKKQDCQIDWNKPGEQIYNFIRGLSPYPGAWTNLKNKETGKIFEFVKIFKSQFEPAEHQLQPKTIVSDNKNYMKVAVKDGFINLLKIQMPSKAALDIKEFLKGYDPGKLEIL